MNINFFCITKKGSNETTVRLLKEACAAQGVTYKNIDVDTHDLTDDLPRGDSNLLYRISTTRAAKCLQLELMGQHDFTTFFTSPDAAFFPPQGIFLQKKHGIRTPRTITHIPSDKMLLKKYADNVGGFPLIVKALGRSHGAGVMKIDSLDSLYSVLDFAKGTGTKKLILREFIDSREHARLIVLGGRVIDSIAYIAQGDDFRTNVDEPRVEQRSFSKEYEDLAVKAVGLLNLEFGGVDILIGKDGTPYLAEVNVPCYFPRCQEITGVPIAEKMITHLVQKATQNLSLN